MVYEALPWIGSGTTCAIGCNLCHTMVLNPGVMILHVVFHKVPYWDHSYHFDITERTERLSIFLYPILDMIRAGTLVSECYT